MIKWFRRHTEEFADVGYIIGYIVIVTVAILIFETAVNVFSCLFGCHKIF